MLERMIVTRHAAVVEWLKSQGITGKVISHATKEDIYGKEVVGTLPLNLIPQTYRYHHIDMNIPAELRGKELSLEDMERCNVKLTQYRVNDPKCDVLQRAIDECLSFEEENCEWLAEEENYQNIVLDNIYKILREAIKFKSDVEKHHEQISRDSWVPDIPTNDGMRNTNRA